MNEDDNQPDFVVHVVEHNVFVDQDVLAFLLLVLPDVVNAVVFDIPNKPNRISDRKFE
jgi:hypothetical protein